MSLDRSHRQLCFIWPRLKMVKTKPYIRYWTPTTEQLKQWPKFAFCVPILWNTCDWSSTGVTATIKPGAKLSKFTHYLNDIRMAMEHWCAESNTGNIVSLFKESLSVGNIFTTYHKPNPGLVFLNTNKSKHQITWCPDVPGILTGFCIATHLTQNNSICLILSRFWYFFF